MYYYIYDSFLNSKKYEVSLNRVESKLLDLGINGRIEKMSLLKNMREVVEEGVRRGAETIIACGNDNTVRKIISALPHYNIMLGIIPFGPNNKIAKLFGIPSAEEACNIISARIIESIDLAKVNAQYFLTSLEVPADEDVKIECENYTIRLLEKGGIIRIANFDYAKDASARRAVSNPGDGLLEAMVIPKQTASAFFSFFSRSVRRSSIFPLRKAKITSPGASVAATVDGETIVKTPMTVEVLPKKLKVIVGRARRI